MEKYDRQLRLWSAHGQKALEEAHVCLINATATGTEILKNLVLPGIGSFTIIDEHETTNLDLESNFFCTSNRLRGEVVTELLMELNPEVKGHFLKEKGTFENYTMVICCGFVTKRLLLEYEQSCLVLGIPFLFVQTSGFAGMYIPVFQIHEVIESHPDSIVEDLRISRPFPELEQLSLFDLGSMTKEERQSIPYPLLLLNLKNKFHGIEKDFKSFLKAEFQKYGNLENMQEALQKSYLTFSKLQRPKIESSNSVFGKLQGALNQFFDLYNDYPLSGSIPDMKSSTKNFVMLQNVYMDKAKRDKEIIKQMVNVPNDLLDIFCKNSRNLKVLKTKNLFHKKQFIEEDENFFSLEEVFWARLQFLEKYGGFDDYDQDVERMKSFCGQKTLDWVKEFCRAGEGELATTASFMGGIVSLEAIKLITKQFVPVSGTLIVDLISSKTKVLK